MHDDFSLFRTVISCLAMRENREKNLLRGFTSTEAIKDNLPEECKKRMFRLGEYQRSFVAKRNFAFDLKGGPWYFGVNAQPRLDVICNSFCFHCKMTNESFCWCNYIQRDSRVITLYVFGCHFQQLLLSLQGGEWMRLLGEREREGYVLFIRSMTDACFNHWLISNALTRLSR